MERQWSSMHGDVSVRCKAWLLLVSDGQQCRILATRHLKSLEWRKAGLKLPTGHARAHSHGQVAGTPCPAVPGSWESEAAKRPVHQFHDIIGRSELPLSHVVFGHGVDVCRMRNCRNQIRCRLDAWAAAREAPLPMTP